MQTVATLIQFANIRLLREKARSENGGGGMCSIVSDALSGQYGWVVKSGAYTTSSGEVICEAHLWNELDDGTLIDATADQFGEGHDIRILLPDDPEYRRYRPEWYEDWNPDVCPDTCPQELGHSKWRGELDSDQAIRLVQERGCGWWLSSTAALNRYNEQQRRYAEAYSVSVASPKM